MHDNDRELMAATAQAAAHLHPLRYLFFELTQRCNLRCAHCGSGCPGRAAEEELSAADFMRVTDRAAQAWPAGQLMFCLTGGEPLLNRDCFAIGAHIAEKGFAWGMTSNGTLIDEACVRELARAGMKTISISLDGLRESHEALRGAEGSFDAAVNALRLLKESGRFRSVQATTVVSQLNLHELPALYDLVSGLGVDSWKLAAIEPMGDALSRPDIFLDRHEHFRLLNFILQRRRTAPFDLTYGCSHFLPKRYERAVRKQPFLCGAGVLIAGVASNGDILPCLDVERREIVKQGNVLHDDIVEVWNKGFALFRSNKADSSETCRACPHRQACRGDSWHAWDFDRNEPRICLEKNIGLS